MQGEATEAPLRRAAHLRSGSDILVSVENLSVEYRAPRGRRTRAVSDVSFDIAKGETLGLVGESGCGKSSLGRALLGLTKPAAGVVMFKERDTTGCSRSERRALASSMQIIFQDPISSLNPMRRIADSVEEPLRVWHRGSGDERRQRVRDMLASVGLDVEVHGHLRPEEMSGGQCQRVSIARALIVHPEFLVCDEPVSALDVSVQAQVLNLVEDLKEDLGLTLLFISHDLAVVRRVADRTAIMYLGRLCEIGESSDIFDEPMHPYTWILLNAIPVPDPDAPLGHVEITGDLPSAADPPSGCRFRTRCWMAREECARSEPALREVAPGHFTACHFAEEFKASTAAERAPRDALEDRG